MKTDTKLVSLDPATQHDADTASQEELEAAAELYDSLSTPDTCVLCNGPCAVMGTLGRREWVRCTQCGMDFGRVLPAGGQVTS